MSSIEKYNFFENLQKLNYFIFLVTSLLYHSAIMNTVQTSTSLIPDHLKKYFKQTEPIFISGKSWADYDSNDELPSLPWDNDKKSDDSWNTVVNKKKKKR